MHYFIYTQTMVYTPVHCLLSQMLNIIIVVTILLTWSASGMGDDGQIECARTTMWLRDMNKHPSVASTHSNVSILAPAIYLICTVGHLRTASSCSWQTRSTWQVFHTIRHGMLWYQREHIAGIPLASWKETAANGIQLLTATWFWD